MAPQEPVEEEKDQEQLKDPDLGFWDTTWCINCASNLCLCDLLKLELKIQFLKENPIAGIDRKTRSSLEDQEEDPQEQEEDTKEYRPGNSNLNVQGISEEGRVMESDQEEYQQEDDLAHRDQEDIDEDAAQNQDNDTRKIEIFPRSVYNFNLCQENEEKTGSGSDQDQEEDQGKHFPDNMKLEQEDREEGFKEEVTEQDQGHGSGKPRGDKKSLRLVTINLLDQEDKIRGGNRSEKTEDQDQDRQEEKKMNQDPGHEAEARREESVARNEEENLKRSVISLKPDQKDILEGIKQEDQEQAVQEQDQAGRDQEQDIAEGSTRNILRKEDSRSVHMQKLTPECSSNLNVEGAVKKSAFFAKLRGGGGTPFHK